MDEITDDGLSPGTGRSGLIRTIAIVAILCVLGAFVWFRVQQGKDDYKVGQCEQSLHTLNEMLDFFYYDRKLDKGAGSYPQKLESLIPQYVASVEKMRCPVFNVPYRYEQRRGGQGFSILCPARHRASYLGEPFFLAATADDGLVHCFVRKGSVIKWTQVGELQRGFLRDRAILFEEPAPELSAVFFQER